ncbi:ATP-grasp domain-containing protein [Legionella shakespearei]|uniref:ATP-grasp domain-containing protein n=1 Tax=Legionella shakespearei DSM 23087 TaxID=1122169 RepID=A0A0W0YKH7_9GAMM|nr:ATP-grasp domain-containing protein [Legionella shakespearei]KTD57220.1 hypothetical protein Lsha_2602 [Legionella shakespearei DSM 23087]
MVKRILLTGIRTPVGLTLLNNLSASGYEVYCADSCKYPLVRFAKRSRGYRLLPSPRFEPLVFKEELIEICVTYQIDLIIPLCEEIFYVAQIKDDLPQGTEVFCDDFELLVAAHNKKEVLQLVEGLPIQIPKTRLLTTDTSFAETRNKVIKQIYSRFGTACYKNISSIQFEQLKKSHSGGWLMQEYLPGKEYCSYSIASKGKLLAHTAYLPKHRLYDSASIYFEPVEDEDIRHFCEAFIRKYNFTGQIAFDFIRTSSGLYIIECNPRATSGLFLLAQHDLADLFVQRKVMQAPLSSPQMLGVAMLTHGIWDAIKSRRFKGWRKDFRVGEDVLQSKRCQLKAGAHGFIIAIALFSLLLGGKKFRKQTTEDIEYPPLVT